MTTPAKKTTRSPESPEGPWSRACVNQDSAIDQIRAAVAEAKSHHTACEAFPDHFQLHDKPCPVPVLGALLGEACEALDAVRGNLHGELMRCRVEPCVGCDAQRTLAKIASTLEEK